VTTLAWFAPPARQSVVRAGLLARGAGRDRLSDGFLLLAVAEGPPLARPVELGTTAAAIRARIAARQPDRELLATLGIDLDEVRRRARAATAARPEDPAQWRMHRSPAWPLRVTLSGPAGEIVLDEGGRKVIEVARWLSRRGQRTLIDREDLLWGLLADGNSEAVAILLRCGASMSRLRAGLLRWHQSGPVHQPG
jgi:ClpA/ClpB-like protein